MIGMETKRKKQSAATMSRCEVAPELLLSVARTLSDAPSWVIFSHMKLDGDALGTATALFEAGVLQGKRVRWMGPDPLPPSYLFLPHVDSYVAQQEYDFTNTDDLYIFLDSANEDRGVKGLQKRAAGVVVVNIDHHEDNTRFGTINCVDPGSSSAAELLWRIMTAGGWLINARMAESLYTGILADTGGFMYSNTTTETHRVTAELLSYGVDPARIDTFIRQTRSIEGMHLWGRAFERITFWGEDARIAISWLTLKDFSSTGALMADTEFLVNHLLLIRGVRFSILFVEEPESVKVSFRSKEGAVPAAFVARELGGGGHPRASGATMPLPLERTMNVVRTAVEKAYAGWTASDR